MDLAYRTELREQNEVNFQRFDARLEQRIAESEARLDRRVSEVEAHLRIEIAAVRGDVQSAESRLRADMAGLRAEMLKWMFLFWLGTVGAIALSRVVGG